MQLLAWGSKRRTAWGSKRRTAFGDSAPSEIRSAMGTIAGADGTILLAVGGAIVIRSPRDHSRTDPEAPTPAGVILTVGGSRSLSVEFFDAGPAFPLAEHSPFKEGHHRFVLLPRFRR